MNKKPEYLPAYEGNDMAAYIMKCGFELSSYEPQSIKSITNVRDTAIIVTDYNIYCADPCYGIGFSIRLLQRL